MAVPRPFERDKDWREVRQFLASQPLATISTVDVSGDRPESALIAFVETPQLEILFETFVDSRKFRNLQANNRVSLVIGWDLTKHVTVQYEGRALPVRSGQIAACKQLFLAKNTPCTAAFLNNPRARLFKIIPSFIRYSDYTGPVPRILERHFRYTNKMTNTPNTTGYDFCAELVREQAPELFCDNCGHYPLQPVHGHFMCSNCHLPTKCCEGAPIAAA